MDDPISVLHPHQPINVRPTTSLRDAIKIMLARGIGSVLIVDGEGRLLWYSQRTRSLTKIAGQVTNCEEVSVQEFMTREPETVTATDKLAFALLKMDVGGYRHLPVVKDGKPAGVISVRDLLRHITRLCNEYG